MQAFVEILKRSFQNFYKSLYIISVGITSKSSITFIPIAIKYITLHVVQKESGTLLNPLETVDYNFIQLVVHDPLSVISDEEIFPSRSTRKSKTSCTEFLENYEEMFPRNWIKNRQQLLQKIYKGLTLSYRNSECYSNESKL